jgi:hypothetical protein
LQLCGESPAAERNRFGLPFASRVAMNLRAWPLLAFVGACSSQGPRLESTELDDDFLYATYSGSCGQPRLSWTGSLDSQTPEAPLLLDYQGDDAGDCTREAVLDLRPIRDAGFATHLDTVRIKLLVPVDTSNGAFSSVDYFAVSRSECAPAGSAALVTSPTAEAFALSTGLDFTSCGREVDNDGTRCCRATTAGYDCLMDAFASCVPARFGVVTGTLEGDPIFTDYFVKASDAGCRLFVVTDRTQDAYRDMNAVPVKSLQCGRASLEIAAPGECPSLALDDCGL